MNQVYFRPVFLVGAGCVESCSLMTSISRAYGIPVVTSLPAVGAIPSDDPLCFGMIGHMGIPSANKIVHESDYLIVLGSRLDVRQTGTEVDQFAPNAEIIWVNNDWYETAVPRIKTNIVVSEISDCRQYLEEFDIRGDFSDWINRCGELAETLTVPDSEMARIIGKVDEMYEGSVIFCTGVGSHQQHCARHLTLDLCNPQRRRQFLTSAGHGTMGAGLPMAIGAAMETKRKVVLIDGDGSFQLSLNELGTIMAHFAELDIDIHIIDNGSGGIVSQFARLQGYDPRETTWINPDFEKIAGGYGLKVRVHRVEEEGCWPILEGGHVMSDMTYPKEKL